jgi:hypothetical protein
MNSCALCKNFAQTYDLQVVPGAALFRGDNPKMVGGQVVYVCTRVHRNALQDNWTGHTCTGQVVLLRNTNCAASTVRVASSIARRACRELCPIRDPLTEGVFYMSGESDDDEDGHGIEYRALPSVRWAVM